MISYIKGAITHKTPTYVVIETAGIGYQINISLNTYRVLEPLESAKVLTHLLVKEDSHTLYGFAEDKERHLFVQLISVSGIGPATAQIMLSSLSVEEIQAGILEENAGMFHKVKGIGPKTAKRIIIDLKDKIKKSVGENVMVLPQQDNTIHEEALSALVALGFGKSLAQKTLQKIVQQGAVNTTTAERLIKLALKEMT